MAPNVGHCPNDNNRRKSKYPLFVHIVDFDKKLEFAIMYEEE